MEKDHDYTKPKNAGMPIQILSKIDFRAIYIAKLWQAG